MNLPQGEVVLYCEMLPTDMIKFSFVRGEQAEFRLLLVDDQLSPSYRLLTTAELAGGRW